MAGVKNFYAKVVQFTNRYVEIVKDLNTSKDYIYFGHDNLLPNKCIKYIKDSGTANKCIGKISEYTEADGFVEKSTQNFQFNPDQKGDALLSDICMQVPIFQGFALLISRKQDGTVGESKVLPFQKIRKSKEGGFWYNQNLGTSKYKESEWKKYPEFKGVKVNPALLNDLKEGEIFYAFKKTAENPFYPIPDYYAGIEDVITSAELQKLDLEMAINGFMPSAFLTFIGHPNNEVEGANGQTVAEQYIEELKGFTGLRKNADGMAGRNSLFVTWAATKEEAPILQPFDAKAILDAANAKRDAVNRDVCRLFGVHPVLIGHSEPTILGNQQALSNAQKTLVDTVNKFQRFISDSLKKVYPDMDFSISQVQPLAVADTNLLNVLSEDEKRNIFWGLEPIERPIASESQRLLDILNGVSPLLATKLIEVIPQDKLMEMLGIKITPSGEPN